MRDDARADRGRFDLTELEDERSSDVLALERRLAHVELPRLVVVVREAFGPGADLGTAEVLGKRGETARGRLRGAVVDEPRVRRIVDAASRIEQRHAAVLLKVPKGALRSVDRELREIRAA